MNRLARMYSLVLVAAALLVRPQPAHPDSCPQEITREPNPDRRYTCNTIVKNKGLVGAVRATGIPFLGPGKQTGQFMGIPTQTDRKSTRLNSSHMSISYAVFC